MSHNDDQFFSCLQTFTIDGCQTNIKRCSIFELWTSTTKCWYFRSREFFFEQRPPSVSRIGYFWYYPRMFTSIFVSLLYVCMKAHKSLPRTKGKRDCHLPLPPNGTLDVFRCAAPNLHTLHVILKKIASKTNNRTKLHGVNYRVSLLRLYVILHILSRRIKWSC